MPCHLAPANPHSAIQRRLRLTRRPTTTRTPPRAQRTPTCPDGRGPPCSAGLSLRHLNRKLTRPIQSKVVSDLWRRRADLSNTLRYQWLRNLPGDNPVQPVSYHGTQGVAPLFARQILVDPVFRLGLCQRLGCPAPDTGQRCGRTPGGANNARASLTLMDAMLLIERRGCTPDDTVASGISSPNLPGKLASPPPLSKTMSSQTRSC